MAVSLKIENLGKKFGNHWVLKSVNLNVYPFEKIAILGANGSGKSTLLKIMTGFFHHEAGLVSWNKDDIITDHPNFSFSSPYLNLFDHLTVEEHIHFHFKQKKSINNLSGTDIVSLGKLNDYNHKLIYHLSSGTRQRLKNTLAILTEADVLFMDEPCSNLDDSNIQHNQALVSDYTSNRIVIIASNYPPEYDFICSKEFKIENKELSLLKNKQLWA